MTSTKNPSPSLFLNGAGYDCIKTDLLFENKKAVAINLRYPVLDLCGNTVATGKINKFYKNYAEALLSYGKGKLYNAACIKIGADEKFKPFSLRLDFDLTYNKPPFLSVAMKIFIFADKTEQSVCTLTWRIADGYICDIGELLKKDGSDKKLLAENVLGRIKLGVERGEHYHDNISNSYIARRIKNENLCLSDRGARVYFAPGLVSPERYGIREFEIITG